MPDSSARWQRLAADLTAAGVPATIDARSYQGGVSRSITVKARDVLVGVHDKWWRKNPDVWIGWQVHTENASGLQTRQWPTTKKRGEVVAAVLAAAGD